MGRIFFTERRVDFSDVDSESRLLPGQLLALFQDTAVRHSEDIGCGVEYLLERKRGWAILNWHICINRMPVLNEFVKFSTWCNKCRRLEAIRNFTVEDKNGNILIYAISKWAFIDLEKRKPSKILPELEEGFTSELPNVIENEKFILKKPDEGDFKDSFIFNVMRGDLDSNGHVNNTKYLIWAADCIDDEIYYNYTLCDIRVTYRKESKRGDVLRAKTAVYSEKDGFTTVVYFVDDKNRDTVYVQISMIWRK